MAIRHTDVEFLLMVQLSNLVKGRMTSMLEKEFKGFDVYKSTESTFFNYVMMDVSTYGRFFIVVAAVAVFVIITFAFSHTCIHLQRE